MSRIKYVDPIIGTVGDEKEKAKTHHGGGKTHPGACFPGGMVQLSPDTITGGDNGTGYNYCNDTIEGFSFNHMSGIGWYGDLGNLQLMPVCGHTDLRSGSNAEIPFKKGTIGWKSPFSHDKETARAGYYSVELERYEIFTEATVTPHCGLLRILYKNSAEPKLLFNFSRRIAGHADFEHIEIVNENCIEGCIHCTPLGGGFGRGGGKIAYDLYFVCEMSVSPKKMRFFADEELAEEGIKVFENEDAGLLAEFDDATKEVVIKCGISYTDIEGARNNFKTECLGLSFDEAVKNAEEAWLKALDMVKVDGSNETDLTLFYTCLYHSLLDPRYLTDADGRFKIDGKIMSEKSYNQRTMFSGWDVYRSEFPLLTIIRPDIVNDEVNSLLKIAEEKNTSFPKWELMGIDSKCMVGDPGLLVIVDAYLKGIRSFDVKKAYEIALASSKCKKELNGRPFSSVYLDCEQYQKEAYFPESLSYTLEFLLADYVMSKLARAMGDKENEDYYLSRAKRYKENYNKELGFMSPKDKNGNFIPVSDEYDETGCIESNIYQQSWYVPYDVPNLSKLFGKERMVSLLEGLFEKADLTAMWNVNYNHSNEPCHNITHYFSLIGMAHRTQYWTRRVQKEAYKRGAFGFCGNEDVGQLSAWYVLSALGFAQVCMGTGVYFVNTPLFKRAEIKLDGNYHLCSTAKTFTVECDKEPLEFPYITSMTLNGVKLNRAYVTYSEITAGGRLEFELSKEPVYEFGNDDIPNFLD